MLQSKKSLAGGSLLLLLLFGLHSASSSLLIVPQEVPSVLSLIYSNIPEIKKGTDSRFGFGFRLGEHADFQVLVELGPQKYTQPLGNEDADDNTLSKRQLSKKEQRKALLQQQRERWHEMTSTERIGTNWLESWSQGVKTTNNNNNKNKKPTKKQTNKVALLPTMPVMPELALKQLQLLHKMATTTTTITTTTQSSTTTTTTTTPKPFTGGPLNLGVPAGFTLRPVEEVPVPQPSQLLELINPRKTRAEITAELMDVSLDEGA